MLRDTICLSIAGCVSSGRSCVALASCDDVLGALPASSVDAVYADPPFNTGTDRKDPRGSAAYADSCSDDAWLTIVRGFAEGARRVLKPDGCVYLHLDWRRVHEAKLLIMDEVFGRGNQLGEIVWSYDWGARQKDRFSRKHDTILHYAKCVGEHRFDSERVDTIPYLAPELQLYRSRRLGKDDGAERIARGTPVTDVFQDINVLGTNSRERALSSYPTMKPAKLIRRLLAPVISSGSLVVDPFCGSGATAEAAAQLGCSFVVGDVSSAAFETTCARVERIGVEFSRVRAFAEDAGVVTGG